MNGLYKYDITDEQTLANVWTLVLTAEQQADKYTRRAYKMAVLACKLENIVMQTGSRELGDVSIKHLKNCHITKDGI